MSNAIFVFIAISLIWALVLYFITRRSYSYKSKVIPVTMLAALIVCAVGYGLILFIEYNESTEACGGCHVMEPMYEEYMGNNPLMVAHREAETKYGPVGCANCHSTSSALSVVPGLIDGIREMLQTTLNYYHLERGHGLERDKCIKCHNPNGIVGENPPEMQRPYWSNGAENEGNLHSDSSIKCSDCHRPHEEYTDCTGCHSGVKNVLSKSVHDWDCVVCHNGNYKEVHEQNVELDMDCTKCHGKMHDRDGSSCAVCHSKHAIDPGSLGIISAGMGV